LFPALQARPGRQAVVTLPPHIDGSNAGQIREQLLWIINRQVDLAEQRGRRRKASDAVQLGRVRVDR
jgi:hypothetical protein